MPGGVRGEGAGRPAPAAVGAGPGRRARRDMEVGRASPPPAILKS